MLLDTGICRIREWARSDVERLPLIANDIRVARYLRHRFPHPYTKEDAVEWLDSLTDSQAPTRFAIDVDGMLAGGIGIQRLTAEKWALCANARWSTGTPIARARFTTESCTG